VPRRNCAPSFGCLRTPVRYPHLFSFPPVLTPTGSYSHPIFLPRALAPISSNATGSYSHRFAVSGELVTPDSPLFTHPSSLLRDFRSRQIDSSSRLGQPIAEAGSVRGRVDCPWGGARRNSAFSSGSLRRPVRTPTCSHSHLILTPTGSHSTGSYSHRPLLRPILPPLVLTPTDSWGDVNLGLQTRYLVTLHSTLVTALAISEVGKLIHPLAWDSR